MSVKLNHIDNMIHNQIEDVSPLEEFEPFEELRLSGNPITNLELLDHIENLEYDPVIEINTIQKTHADA